MNVALTLQYAAVALIVVISACVVVRKQFPGATRRLRIALAIPLLRDGAPPWLRAIGHRVAPAPAAGGADACGACSGCERETGTS